MQIQNISNQQNFNGTVYNSIVNAAQNAKINKALKTIPIEEKSYDLFIADAGENIGITAQASKDVNSLIAPKVTTFVKKTQVIFDSIIKATMQTYEDIVNESNKLEQNKKFLDNRRNY